MSHQRCSRPERRDLNKRNKTEGAKEYSETNKRIQKAVKKTKEDWIGTQCKISKLA